MQKQMNKFYAQIKEIISELSANSSRLIIAIDGNCASGKSTLAEQLAAEISANVVHIDDFYLQPEMRSEERMSRPGGNIDYHRLTSEVLYPLSLGKECIYRAFDCRRSEFCTGFAVTPKPITIVEGAYSCHPCLDRFYACKIFLSIDPNEQMRRIIERNGDQKAKEFRDIWIPRENYYFDVLDIRNKCDFVFNINIFNGVIL